MMISKCNLVTSFILDFLFIFKLKKFFSFVQLNKTSKVLLEKHNKIVFYSKAPVET